MSKWSTACSDCSEVIEAWEMRIFDRMIRAHEQIRGHSFDDPPLPATSLSTTEE